jgi:hypothetical protein
MRVPFTLGDVLRVLVICLVVGFIVKALGFGPVEFWLRIRDALQWAWEHAVELSGRAVEWIAIGAAIVLPLLAIRYAWRALRKRG